MPTEKASYGGTEPVRAPLPTPSSAPVAAASAAPAAASTTTTSAAVAIEQQQPAAQSTISPPRTNGWPWPSSPLTHYNLSRFRSPVSTYLKTSYVTSFHLTLWAALFTVLTVPYTFLVLSKEYKIATGTSGTANGQDNDFTSMVNFVPFCWSFLSLFVGPFFFFFVWHYPFYTTCEDELQVILTRNPSALLSMSNIGQLQQDATTAEGDEAQPLTAADPMNTANNSRAAAAQQMLRPTLRMWLSSFGAVLYICFASMQFCGLNFLSAAGVGFFVRCEQAGFNARLRAAGHDTAVFAPSGVFWAVYSFPLIATLLHGICIIVAIVWLALTLHRKWTLNKAGHRVGVVVILLLLATGLTFLFLWVFVFSHSKFFPPAQPYRRGFRIKNSCPHEIRVSTTGGATGITCADGCPPGTVCNTEEQAPQQCYFSLGNLTGNGVRLSSGEQISVPFEHPPVIAQIRNPQTGVVSFQLQQWSGNLHAKTQCHPVTGRNCHTALCNDCKAYVGPTGPTTLVEMTLLVTGQDYYDVSVINGINVPVAVTPFNGENSFVPSPPDDATASSYYCQQAGRGSWKFKPPSNLYPLVLPSTPSSSCPCSNPNEVCGTAMVVVKSGDSFLPTQQVISACGRLIGLWTDMELCAWSASTFGDCGATASSGIGTNAMLFGCYGVFAQSCFQQGATASCCGCSTWGDLTGTNIKAAFQCQNHNTAWAKTVKPKLEWLKQGAPTCYTYPFDDATSTFTCLGTSSAANGTLTANSNSYDIEFCPGGAVLELLT